MSNTNEVKRFDLKFSNYKSEHLGESEHGAWVKYSSYQSLELENKLLREALEKVEDDVKCVCVEYHSDSGAIGCNKTIVRQALGG